MLSELSDSERHDHVTVNHAEWLRKVNYYSFFSSQDTVSDINGSECHTGR